MKFAGATIKSSSFGAAKLDGFVFTGLDLTDVDFGSSKLANADFRGTTMKNTRFWGATLTNANFSGLTFSTMRSDQFTYADLTGAKFVGASLPSPYRCDWQTFHSTILNGTDFTNANLTNTCFNNIASNSFTGVKFAGANLQGSSFGAAKLDGFDFTGQNLTNVDFGSSKLTGADFRTTTMNNTRFWGETLVNANFSGVTFANPRSDQFTYADLTGAKFVGSTLLTPSGCDWSTFHTTVLNGTDFTNATLTGMCFSRISGSALVNVNFSGAGLRNTSFSGMNLGSSDFTNSLITGSNLSSANFSGVSGIGAQGTGITTNGSTQLPTMWRITSGTLYVTKAPSHAPSITSVIGGEGTITVEWTAPTSNTGDSITGYTVCLNTTCSLESSGSRSKIITSILSPGTKTVTVAAHNAGGDSPVASTTASAMTVPASPALVSTDVADRSLTLNWSAPSVDGGYPVTGYRACVGAVCRDLDASTFSTTFSDLVGGTQYTLRVSAANQLGSSLDTVTTSVPTPFVEPGAPMISAASLSGSTMTLSWDLPTSDGGSAITSYVVCFETLSVCRSVEAPSRTVTVTLTDAQGVFSVRAGNGVGFSRPSRGLIVGGVVVRAGASLAGADLRDADLATLDLRGVNLSGADLRGADLTGARLNDADLSGANLGGAPLVRADLSGADFSGATMTGVDLSMAVLSDTTDFSSVIGTGAKGARITGSTALLPGIWSLSAGKLLVMVEPSAPVLQGVSETPGTITVRWNAPRNAGGGAILGYRVCVMTVRCETFAAPRGSATLTSIPNGSTYSVTVEAWNAAGYSPADSGSVTLAGAPGVPGDVRVQASSGALTVRWARVVSSGGSPITGFSVCAGVSCVSVAAGDRVGVVSGLVNGQSYAVVVYALSAYGTSVGGSGGSSTPFTSPSAVSISSVEGANRSITVDWTAGFDGGSPLTGYEICAVPDSGRRVCVDADAAAVSAVVPGLINGVEYAVSVVARNVAGAGAEASGTATPSTVPSIPKIVSATMRPEGIDVVWSAPVSDGGADLLRYQICADSSCVNVSASSTTGSVTGLTNGSTYSVTVKAVNKQGSSGTQSVPVTLAGAPGVPGDVRVQASSGALTVRWARVVSSGGSPITGFSVCAGVSCVSVAAGDRVGVVSGLVNGQSYAVVVYALSAYGTSVGGSGGSSTPFTSPSAVSISSVEGANRSITVDWTAGFDGGSPLTGYEICAVPDSGRRVCVDADAAAVSAVVPGLINGVEYAVSVVARNVAGAGAEASGTATPSTVPSIPKILTRPGMGQIQLTWDGPRSDGGADVTGYSVCLDDSCVTVDPALRSYLFDGLTNGTQYTVSVLAINVNGSSGAAIRRSTPRLGLSSFLAD